MPRWAASFDVCVLARVASYLENLLAVFLDVFHHVSQVYYDGRHVCNLERGMGATWDRTEVTRPFPLPLDTFLQTCRAERVSTIAPESVVSLERRRLRKIANLHRLWLLLPPAADGARAHIPHSLGTHGRLRHG